MSFSDAKIYEIKITSMFTCDAEKLHFILKYWWIVSVHYE
jgi:hypothetical protein